MHGTIRHRRAAIRQALSGRCVTTGANRGPRHRLLVTALAVVGFALPAFGITFPSTGYRNIRIDVTSPSVPDSIDITAIAYQSDATYAYFKITVAGTAGFSSDRFYLYIDITGDGLPDRLLRNTSASNATLDTWGPAQRWVGFGLGWSEDPNDSPDDHIYLACLLSDVSNGNFTLMAGAQDQPGFDEGVRDPHNDPALEEVVGSHSSNPTVVAVSAFGVERRRNGLQFSWRVQADADIAGFNLYAYVGREGRRIKLNRRLIRGQDPFAEPQYRFACRSRRAAFSKYDLEAIRADGRRGIVASARLRDASADGSANPAEAVALGRSPG